MRYHHLQPLHSTVFDVLIIGGGINGAVSAAALTGRRASVALIDQRDFAGFTSQESSNLAWGGIKYLETAELGLVYQLCQSRNRLMQAYPSSVQEIRFLTTIPKGFRHRPWTLWLGAWLYWALGHGQTATPRLFSPRQLAREETLLNTASSSGGLAYSDAYFVDNDARFVFNFVRRAIDQGGVAANYVEALGSYRERGMWVTQARDVITNQPITIRAKALVNAAGPFVDPLNQRNGQSTEHHHVFSKGIHLMVKRLTSSHHVLTFFADDGRLFFAIPMGSKTCIGTTDTRVDSPVATVTEADRQFVLENINQRLRLPTPLTTGDIIAERCGVRPLAVTGPADEDTAFFKLSRKHAIDTDPERAYLSIFGGKLTDCLNLGHEVCDEIEGLGIALVRTPQPWYGEPNAELKLAFFRLAAEIGLNQYTPPSASEPLTARCWRRYGMAAVELLDAIRHDRAEAEIVMGELMRCEFRLVARRERVVKLEDFLRRRTTLALELTADELKQADGLRDACQLLFGDAAQAQYEAYFQAAVATPTS